MTTPSYRPAPEWETDRWFNAPAPLTLAGLRGRVVLLGAFQMLCPGCVQTLLPQLQQAHALFDPKQVAVVGLHTVFEHHAAMTPVALEAFLHEYRIGFPVGVDAPSAEGPIPRTMAAYGMRGTPTLLLVDRAGRLRQHHFGQVEDLLLGAQIAMLGAEAAPIEAMTGAACNVDGGCD